MADGIVEDNTEEFTSETTYLENTFPNYDTKKIYFSGHYNE